MLVLLFASLILIVNAGNNTTGACTHLCAKLYASVDPLKWNSPQRDHLTGVAARNLKICAEECDTCFKSYMSQKGGHDRLVNHLKTLSYETFDS